MRVFMLGWEFPPFISGGLGTACYGLTQGLDSVGVQVCFVLPTAKPVGGESESPEAEACFDRTLIRESAGTQNQKIGSQPLDMPCSLNIHKLDAVLEPYSAPRTQRELDLEKIKIHARQTAAKFTRENFSTRSSQAKELLRNVIANVRATKVSQVAKPKKISGKSEPQSTMPGGSVVLGGAGVHYDGDLMSQIQRYAELAVNLALTEEFDVIHAHDWMTYAAGIAVKEATGKPLVVHVHSTEFDRSGENVNQQVYDIERAGMTQADKVVCVSYLTRSIAIRRYNVLPSKIEVVYNAVDIPELPSEMQETIARDEKIVLFLGRITMQKGPEYFLEAARKVVDKYPKVRFVIAGSGDMTKGCIELAADLKLGKHVTFTGFLRGNDVARVFKMADLYVMPSVSEPFGIAPLEAMSHNVPVLISKQSGVSEVLTHALKVDFWDVDEIANKILAVLRHDALSRTLKQHVPFELQKLSWEDSGVKLKNLYETLIK